MQFNVYKIECDTTGLVYYGSTEETIEQRLSIHKNDYRSYLKGNFHYITSFEILKNGNYEIKLLEKCDNKIHMIERERYYIKFFPCVNKYIPGRTKKEWREDNKEEISEKKKEYYEANKEKLTEYQKEYHENNREKILQKKKQKYTCECGSTLRIDSKARHERRKKHQDFINKKK